MLRVLKLLQYQRNDQVIISLRCAQPVIFIAILLRPNWHEKEELKLFHARIL